MAESDRAPGAYKNRLLSRLSPAVFQSLALQAVELPVELSIYEPNRPMEYAYFPESGVISVVSVMDDGGTIEVGTIGREGMAGSVLLLETETMPFRSFVQVGGHGFRTSAARVKQTAETYTEFRALSLRYEAVFRTQTMQGMTCNGMHNVIQRCSRWLLMTRDRVDSDDLKLTHEFLALMLGVRRASVSEVIKPLQVAGLISSQRGRIQILDRQGLEAKSCECYKIMVERERST
jgi:CRP-like cAMP-binding protein